MNLNNAQRTIIRLVIISFMLLGFSWAASALPHYPEIFISWNADGTMLAIASDSTIKIEDTTGQILNTFTDLEYQVTAPVWNSDNQLAMANGPDVEIWNKAWDATAMQLQITYQYYADLNPPEPQGFIYSLAWKPDGTQMAVGILSIIDIWDTQTEMRLFRLQNEGVATSLAWSINNQIVSAAGGLRGHVNLWSATTGQMTKGLLVYAIGNAAERPGVQSIAWSPDNTQIALAAADGTVRLWDTTTEDFWTESEYATFDKGHQGYALSVSWSPDGQYLASGGQDNTLRIWDIAKRQQIGFLEAEGFVQSVAFNPGGTQLAYGVVGGDGRDAQVKIVLLSDLLNPTSELTATPAP